MCRPLGAVSVLLLLFIGTSGRNILQDSGATEPTSFAAKKNANSEAVTSADAATQQALQNQKTIQLQGKQTQVKSHSTQKKTLQQVNADAPTYTDDSTGVSVKPVASSRVVSDKSSGAQPDGTANAASNTVTASATPAASQQVVGQSDPKAAQQAVAKADPTAEQAVIGSTGALDQDQISGDTISQLVGVRIATPFFGTGFNFCVDRYFSSFPKVGIVIPNPAIWLLPEFQDLAMSLSTTLSLPNDASLLHGAYVEPTSDGFLIQLPSLQPSQLPDLGLRYGIQIGQAFGWDFGYGIIKDICFIDFVIV